MDGNSPNQSPNMADLGSGAWIPVWDGDESSISGLNLDHSRQLHNLVEDKDIAARAVAFVVNSTRKGIVPLCADVANLLRSKRRQDIKIHRLKGDNDRLRSSLTASTRTSQSTSPIPNSLHSCDNRTHCRCSQSLCSDCSSQCSSVVGNSPGLEKGYIDKSPCSLQTSAFTRPFQHPLSCMDPEHHRHTLFHRSPESHRHSRDDRKNSLPEIVSEPGLDVMRIKPLLSTSIQTVSTETQCCLPTSDNPLIEAQFRDSLQINSKLAEELGAAKREIELLKGKLKELEMNQLAREYQDKFQVVNETAAPPTLSVMCSSKKEPLPPPAAAVATATTTTTAPNKQQNNNEPTCYNSNNTGTVKKKSCSPITVPSPLVGCICTNCISISDSSVHLNTLDSLRARHKAAFDISSHIVIKGEKTGYIRYLGHLDGVGQPKVVFAGVELDAPVGRHDGILNSRRYFTCGKDCGIFVPLHEVVCVIPDKSKSVHKRASSLRLQRCSSDVEQNGMALTECGQPFQRRGSDLDQRIKGRSNGHQRREKETRFIKNDDKDLKLPKDVNLTEGHLV